MMNAILRGLLAAALAAASLGAAAAAALPDAAAAAAPDAAGILARSDRARGGGLPGITWDVRADTTGADDDSSRSQMLLRVSAAANASVSETLEPVRQKGARMLNVDRVMWLTRPGLKKPIPISPRQRLTGQAAVGDIAATNYVQDYAPRLEREEACGAHRCWVLDLTAKAKNTTYDRILYWVTVDGNVAARAEFYSVSGKLLKSAEFEYGNTIDFDGKRLPFVSRMVIRDALTPAATTLEYRSIRVLKIPATEFDVGHLD
jgi:hypothetical protein